MQIKLRGGRITKRLTGKVKLPAGSHTEDMQTKSVEPTTAEQVILPDNGYAGLSRVTVGRVPLQNKTATPGAAAQAVSPDAGYMGLGSVAVDAVPLQNKSVKPTGETQTVTAGSGYYGLGAVEVKEAKMQGKVVTPGTEQQFITPDNGYDGLASVAILPEPDLIPENIRKGVTIFGVAGSYDGATAGGGEGEGGGGDNPGGGDNTGGGGDLPGGGDNTGGGGDTPGGESTEHSGTIPPGGLYTVYATREERGPGDPFPQPGENDFYYYGDYLYTYADHHDACTAGWDVLVTDKTKTSYGAILESIAGARITSLKGTFMDCANMVTAPVLPNAGGMHAVFADCTSLTGEVSINWVPDRQVWTSDISKAFFGTVQPIKIVGDCPDGLKKLLAETATNGNVTY